MLIATKSISELLVQLQKKQTHETPDSLEFGLSRPVFCSKPQEHVWSLGIKKDANWSRFGNQAIFFVKDGYFVLNLYTILMHDTFYIHFHFFLVKIKK